MHFPRVPAGITATLFFNVSCGVWFRKKGKFPLSLWNVCFLILSLSHFLNPILRGEWQWRMPSEEQVRLQAPRQQLCGCRSHSAVGAQPVLSIPRSRQLARVTPRSLQEVPCILWSIRWLSCKGLGTSCLCGGVLQNPPKWSLGRKNPLGCQNLVQNPGPGEGGTRPRAARAGGGVLPAPSSFPAQLRLCSHCRLCSTV